jgi:integrase
MHRTPAFVSALATILGSSSSFPARPLRPGANAALQRRTPRTIFLNQCAGSSSGLLIPRAASWSPSGSNKDGFHTWKNEEIELFEKRWPIGTRERLALDLLLYTGLSRGDVVRLGRQHVTNGVITFRMEKQRGEGMVYPPMLPVLAATISASKTGDLTFHVTERGTPFVKESFGLVP